MKKEKFLSIIYVGIEYYRNEDLNTFNDEMEN